MSSSPSRRMRREHSPKGPAMDKHNGGLRFPTQQELMNVQAQQALAAQQQQMMQQAVVMENAKAIAQIAATLLAGIRYLGESDHPLRPQEAVETAAELLFRSLTTLQLPRMQAREKEIRETLLGESR